MKLKEASEINNNPGFVHENLRACSHIFVRYVRIRGSLQPHYDRPHPVVSRKAKYFDTLIDGKNQVITTEILNPAFMTSN